MPHDPGLHAVTYAFDAAFLRMCEAATEDGLMAELSNALHHFYRLRELWFRRLPNFGAAEASDAALRASRGASWIRNFDTHQLFEVASEGDVFSDYFTATFGVLT